MPFFSNLLRQKRFQWAVVLLLPLLLYANSLSNDYNLDDEFIIRDHPLVQEGISGIPALLRSSFNSGDASKDYGYRPIPMISAAVEYQLFGEKPFVSHSISLLLYLATLAALFVFLRLFWGNTYPLLPFVAVLFFALHPIHTEVVDNVKCRDQLLAFLFTVATWYYACLAAARASWGRIAAAIGSGILALLSNPTAVVMLALTPLWLYFGGKVSWKKILGTIAVWIILYVGYEYLVDVIKGGSSKLDNEKFFWENPLYVVKDIELRLGLAFGALWQYLRLLLLPYPLSYYYGFNQIPLVSFWSPMPILSALVYIGIGIFALLQLPRRSCLGFIAAYYCLAILPFSNLLKPGPGIIAERWIYACSLSMALLTAYCLLYYAQYLRIDNTANPTPTRRTKIALIAGLFLLTTYSGIIIKRNADWRDLETLVFNDLEHLPQSVKAKAFAAELLMPKYLKDKRDTRLSERIALLLQETIQLDSTYAEPHNNLGLIYENRQDTAAAIRYYQKAIALRQNRYPTATTNLANIYFKQRRYSDIIDIYRANLLADSTQLEPHINLARILSLVDRNDEALALNQIALRRFPQKRAFIYDNIARFYYERGDKLTALQQWENAYHIDTTDAAASFKLYNAYQEAGMTDKAQYYQRVFELNNRKNKKTTKK